MTSDKYGSSDGDPYKAHRHPFFFRRSRSGEVSEVLHHPEESQEALSVKRGMASCFHLVVGDALRSLAAARSNGSSSGSGSSSRPATAFGARSTMTRRGATWHGIEDDYSGPSQAQYSLRPALPWTLSGQLRRRALVQKWTTYPEPTPAVPDGFDVDTNITALVDLQTGSVVTLRRTAHIKPNQANLQGIAAAPGSPPPPQIEGFDFLPSTPHEVVWRLTALSAIEPSRRRLHAQQAEHALMVSAPLMHVPPSAPDTYSSARTRRTHTPHTHTHTTTTTTTATTTTTTTTTTTATTTTTPTPPPPPPPPPPHPHHVVVVVVVVVVVLVVVAVVVVVPSGGGT